VWFIDKRDRDAIKVVSVRATAFERARLDGGNAPLEWVSAPADQNIARVVGQG